MAILGDAIAEEGCHVESVTLLIDYRDRLGLGGANRSLFQAFFGTLNQYCPERLGTVLLVNAPGFATLVWNFIKGLLTPKTQGKIKIVGCDEKEKREALEALFDIDELPIWCGGKADIPFHEKGDEASPLLAISCCISLYLTSTRQEIQHISGGNRGTQRLKDL